MKLTLEILADVARLRFDLECYSIMVLAKEKGRRLNGASPENQLVLCRMLSRESVSGIDGLEIVFDHLGLSPHLVHLGGADAKVVELRDRNAPVVSCERHIDRTGIEWVLILVPHLPEHVIAAPLGA